MFTIYFGKRSAECRFDAQNLLDGLTEVIHTYTLYPCPLCFIWSVATHYISSSPDSSHILAVHQKQPILLNIVPQKLVVVVLYQFTHQLCQSVTHPVGHSASRSLSYPLTHSFHHLLSHPLRHSFRRSICYTICHSLSPSFSQTITGGNIVTI